VGRMSKLHGVAEAELAALVRDGFQGKGLGSELYRQLLQIARAERLHRIHSNMLKENIEMKAICKSLGFKLSDDAHDDNLVLAELAL